MAPARLELSLSNCRLMTGLLSGLLLVPASWAIDVVSGPTLHMNPGGLTPLAGVIELATDAPSRVTLVISDGHAKRSVQFPDFQTNHAVQLLGLTPQGEFTVEVTITDEAGIERIVSPLLNVATGSLPAAFPLIDVLASDPARMEPGFTLLDTVGRGANFVAGGLLLQIILGPRGEVVWYATTGGSAVNKPANGNLIYRQGALVYERDMLGNIVRTIKLDDPGIGLHHDLYQTASGGFLSLSRQTVSVEGYPTSNVDPGAPMQTADVRDEPVVVFAPDGRLVASWSLVDMLDATRVGYLTLSSVQDGFDAFHTNAVIDDSADDTIIVSVRHQDAIVKFSRSTGEIHWILGPHTNWTPEFQPYLLEPVGNEFEWQYHQHAPMITSFGTLMLFDNGNFRSSPFDGTAPLEPFENYSRAVEYSIDEAAMQVEQVWDFGSPDSEWLYADRVGDADRLPETGNVLITFGGTSYTGGVQHSELGLGGIHTRIIEVTHDDPAEKVFDVRIYNPEEGAPRTQIYRSDRIPSLYPLTVRIDSDGDGAYDAVDIFPLDPAESDDTDSDGIGNNADEDDDGDGISDTLEVRYRLDPLDASDGQEDADGDGVSNFAEIEAGTDPMSAPQAAPAESVPAAGNSSRLDILSIALLVWVMRRGRPTRRRFVTRPTE